MDAARYRWNENLPSMMTATKDEIIALVIEAILYGARFDLNDHSAHSADERYTMDPALLELLARAKALGIAVPPLWDGHEWPELPPTTASNDRDSRRAAIERERALIVAELARYLYQTEERLDPGTNDVSWADVTPFTRSFYCECVWSLLSRASLLKRFLELSDGELGQNSRTPPQTTAAPAASEPC